MKKFIVLFFFLSSLLNAQNFEILKVDTSSFPLMKAQFFSKNADNNPFYNYAPTSFTILENRVPREVLGLECNNDSIAPISIVIAFDVTMDQSGDNGNISRDYIDVLIDNLPEENAEMAIIGFSRSNGRKCDFTNDKYKLKKSLNGRTLEKYEPNYNSALTREPYGALRILENIKNRRLMVVIVTDYDYRDKPEGDESTIISKSQEIGASITIVNLGEYNSELLSNISYNTGGFNFSGVDADTDVISQVKQFYSRSRINLCELTWMSDYQCRDRVSIKFESESYTNDYIRTIDLNKFQLNNFEVSHNSINFTHLSQGQIKDTVLKITATYADVILDNIQLTPEYPDFTIQENFPAEIKKGESRDIKIKYKSVTPSYIFSALIFSFGGCTQRISLSASEKSNENYIQTITIDEPKEGDLLLAGTDTIITWSSIDKVSSVDLDFSTDKGKSWTSLVTDYGGTEYIWSLPPINSDGCRLVISQEDKNESSYGQIDWSKSYGGSDYEDPAKIIQTLDGGYLVLGDSESSDNDVPMNYRYEDLWVLKLDSEGNIEWSKVYGGSSYDRAKTCLQLPNGDFIIAGETDSDDNDLNHLNLGGLDVWLIRLDSKGDIIWSKTFGGDAGDEVNSIQYTSNNGLILAGRTYSESDEMAGNRGAGDAWVLKLDSLGNIEWSRIYGGSDADEAFSVQQTHDGGYIVASNTYSSDYDLKESFGGPDIWILKLRPNGEIQWSKLIGDSLNNFTNQIIQTYDGNYILSADYRSKNPFEKDREKFGGLYVFKLDSYGEVIWQKRDYSLGYDLGSDIKQTPDGGFLVAGKRGYIEDETILNRGSYDALLFKLDANGDKVWDKIFGGTKQDLFSSICLTKDGGYATFGRSNSADENVETNYGKDDLWVTKFKPDTYYRYSDTTNGFFSIRDPKSNINDTKSNFSFSIQPNIATSSTNVFIELTENGATTLELYDSQGRKIETLLSGYQLVGKQDILIDVSQYISGRYFLKLTTPSITRTELLEVQR